MKNVMNHSLGRFFLLLLCMTMFLACERKGDEAVFREENKRAAVEFCKVASIGGAVLSEEWGIASKSKMDEISFNFVFFTRQIQEDEWDKILKKITNFYKKAPFQIWIEDTNKHIIPFLEQKNYKNAAIFPGLSMSLQRDFGGYAPVEIKLKAVSSPEEARDWATVTSIVQKLPLQHLTEFCETALKKAPHVKFYVAYFQDKPISSRMMIIFNRSATGYLSSTLSDYREKGAASYLLSFALNRLKKNGVQTFVLQALSCPVVWKKFGLKENGATYYSFIPPAS